MLNDNQKIGVGLISLGLLFIVIGILLFLDAALMAIGTYNVFLFLDFRC